ncbi:MAG: DUF116 domain-containing protein [Anaerolineae bacterium]|nr:DUF116 domain-containing protein [Anaerolineae bacterium]
MDIITYSLRNQGRDSEQYYRDVAAFTDEVLRAAEDQLGPLVTAFQPYVRDTCDENPRSLPEYAFELLTLGVLWRVYANDALAMGHTSGRVLAALVQLRKRGGTVKKIVDRARGLLANMALMRSVSNNGRNGASPPVPTPDQLDHLLEWLAAAAEFNQEVKRLRVWAAFFATQHPDQTVAHLAAVMAFADWFAERSLTVLGPYTTHVEQFRRDKLQELRWRENRVFCGRARVEYHMNMIGTEIMNRAFRARFLAAERKVVFVPPCMKAKLNRGCEAIQTPVGERCMHCEPGCRVHQLTKLGEKHGFQVFMLPDELSVFSAKTAPSPEMQTLGVVGVSCVLTNVTGGWRTRELGVPAQGVLLDYVGCPFHWHKDGIPTDINFKQVLRVLGIETPAREEAEAQRDAV